MSKPVSLLIICCVILSFAFVCLAVSASQTPFATWDPEITHWVQSIAVDGFHEMMVAMSWPGNGWLAWILTILVGSTLILCGHKREGIFSLAGTGLAAFLSGLFKDLVGRPRPSNALVTVWFEYPNESFPSGHVVFYTEFFGFLLFLLVARNLSVLGRYPFSMLLALLIAGVGISRVYLGAHWLSDVLGGYCLGICVLGITIISYRVSGPNKQHFRKHRCLRE
jgi:undecaprenyl-diphosphatase